ncbi:hypothetical protein, partial [Streptomyces brevispora]|uniref:hypothetical protein n=1 Tax=Streptomyces brevispora TaxID=887462 RepID=UPI0035D6F500
MSISHTIFISPGQPVERLISDIGSACGALLHVKTPGYIDVAEFARGGLPAAADTHDGNTWTDGHCWLYCGQGWTRVLWIGPVSVASGQEAMYACGPCIRALQEQAWQSILLHDEPTRLAPLSTSVAAEQSAGCRVGRHRARGGLLRRGWGRRGNPVRASPQCLFCATETNTETTYVEGPRSE